MRNHSEPKEFDTLRRIITDVEIRDLRVNPLLDDRLFSVMTLEQQRPLDHAFE